MPKIVCPDCHGDKGWMSYYYIDYRGRSAHDGEGEWIWCETCDATGYLLHYKAVNRYIWRLHEERLARTLAALAEEISNHRSHV